MKTSFVSLMIIVWVAAGCSVFKSSAQDDKTGIVSAGYKSWSEPPVRGDVPETGTDLALIVKNWPDQAEPTYIVYNKRKSFGAQITDTTALGVIINGRIITASSVMMQDSEVVDQSDRLVYETSDGTRHHLEIDQWVRIEE